MKELKPRQRARAKWITSPQIERSSCVRKLVPPAELKLGGGGALKVGVWLSGWVEREGEGKQSERMSGTQENLTEAPSFGKDPPC